MALLGDRFPDWTEQDFYEIEIATTAIVFGFLMERCNARFSVKQKINRTLDNLLKLYDVGAEEREEVIAQVLALDLNDCAEKIMAWVLEKERVKSADYLPVSYTHLNSTGSIIICLLVKVYSFPFLVTETPLPFKASRSIFKLLVSVTVRV